MIHRLDRAKYFLSLFQLDAYLIEEKLHNHLSRIKEKTTYSSANLKLLRRIKESVFQNPPKLRAAARACAPSVLKKRWGYQGSKRAVLDSAQWVKIVITYLCKLKFVKFNKSLFVGSAGDKMMKNRSCKISWHYFVNHSIYNIHSCFKMV